MKSCAVAQYLSSCIYADMVFMFLMISVVGRPGAVMLDDDAMMACSVTTTTSTSSSNCTSAPAFVEIRPLPTISLDAAAAVDDDEQDRGTNRDRDRLTADDDVSAEVAESKRVPRAGHDRKKHSSYRYLFRYLFISLF